MINQIRKIINHRSETITGAAFIISFFTFLGSLLGILRNALLASNFGASGELDIYYAAFRIPDFIYSIFIIGAVSASFIPFFSKNLEESNKKAWRFASAVFFWIGMMIGILALLVIIFARPILSAILVGFSPEKLNRVVFLTRIMMIQPFLLGFSSIAGAILEVFRLFMLTALSPLMYNLGIIIGIWGFVPIFGLEGLAYGVVLGAFLSFVIKIPSLLNIGFQWHLDLIKVKEDIKAIFLIMIPRTLGMIIYQVFLFAVVSVSSLLEEGSLAIFNLANDIQNLPQTIFALSFAVAAFPRLAQLEIQNKKEDFVNLFTEVFLKILFLLIPISAFFIIFRAQIIRLLLGYGRFGWSATFSTIDVFTILVLGMVFQGLLAFLIRTFFAQRDVTRPFISALLAYSFGALLCFRFGLEMGISGVALAFILANILYFCLLFLFLLLRFKKFPFKIVIKGILKIFGASFIAASSSYLFLRVADWFLDTHRIWGLMSQTAFSLFGGLIIFVIVSWILKIKEFEDIYSLILKKIQR